MGDCTIAQDLLILVSVQNPVNEEPVKDEAPYRITYVDEDDPFGLGTQSKTAIAKLSRNAWVCSKETQDGVADRHLQVACGNNRYILEMISELVHWHCESQLSPSRSWLRRGVPDEGQPGYLHHRVQMGDSALVRASQSDESKQGSWDRGGSRTSTRWRRQVRRGEGRP